ncbi:uncharacterized protein [Cherax quadricarinatus]
MWSCLKTAEAVVLKISCKTQLPAAPAAAYICCFCCRFCSWCSCGSCRDLLLLLLRVSGVPRATAGTTSILFRDSAAEMLRIICCASVAVMVVMAQQPLSFPDDVLADPDDLPFPTYSQVPDTAFSCEGRSGLFPDPEAGCQAFHICKGRFMYSFLCPNATLFSANYRVCDHYYNVRCATTNPSSP